MHADRHLGGISGEITSTAIVLCLRRLQTTGIMPLRDERGLPLVEFGLQTAERVQPFTRLVSWPKAAVKIRQTEQQRWGA